MKYQIQDWHEFKWIWENNGKIPGVDSEREDEKLSVKDAISTTNVPLLFPKVVNQIVREAAEPILVGTNLLTRIQYKYGQNITFPAMGAMTAADIAEGQEYPEQQLSMGGGMITANIGKVGLAVKFSEEMLARSQFDVMGMHLRAAGRALARHKEEKIFNYIRATGVTVFDNLNPTSSLFGVTHGRNLRGQPNGSLVVDDIFDCWGQVVTQGYTPNTLLMHPLTWVMWVKDPVLRAFALQNGGGVFFASWTGNPAGRAPWGQGQNITPGQTPDGSSAPHSSTATGLLSYPQNINSAPQLPSYANLPLVIIVSPFVWFDARRRITDIYLFDRNELGILWVEEDVNSGEWQDPARDLLKVKMREKYAISMLAEGLSTGVLRNVFVRPNEVVLPAQATIEVSSALTSIDAGTAISI